MSKVTIAGDVNGTGVFTLAAPNGNTNRTLTLPDEAGTLVTTASLPNPLTSGTAVATTSGTAIDFVSIPSWVKRVTVSLAQVSTNGGSNMLLQLGDSGGIEATGYTGTNTNMNYTSPSTTNPTGVGFYAVGNAGLAPSALYNAVININLVGSNQYLMEGHSGATANAYAATGICNKSLTSVLTQIRLTTVNGTDTFDAGSINIMYE